MRSSAGSGVPLLLFVAGGAWVLSQFTQGTVEARDVRVKSQSERAFNIAEEHSAISKKLNNFEDSESKRIPRP